MRTDHRRATVNAMASALQLVVEINLDSRTISGRISTNHDPARPFHGWLELASTIETLRNAALNTRAHPIPAKEG